MKGIWPKIGLGVILGSAVAFGLALFADLGRVAASIAGFHWPYVPFVLGLTTFSYAVRFIKWHYYIRRVGAEGIRWRDSLRVFVGGFPLALSPGKIAEPLKAVWLKQYSPVPVARGIPVVLAERISDGVAMALLSTFGVLAYPDYWPGFALVLAGLVGVMVVSQIRPLAVRLLDLGERLPRLSRFSHHLREFYEGMYQLFDLKSALLATGLGVIGWSAEGVGMYLVLRGLGLPAGLQVLSAAVFVFSFSTIVGAVSPLPGGLGAAEASLAGLIVLTLAAPEATAASATLLIRFFTLWFGVGLGMLVLLSSRQLLLLQPPPASTGDG